MLTAATHLANIYNNGPDLIYLPESPFDMEKFLNDVMQEELAPIRERRKEYQDKIHDIIEMIKVGNDKANKVANQTLQEMKQAMGIDYFYNDEFEKEQINKFKTN